MYNNTIFKNTFADKRDCSLIFRSLPNRDYSRNLKALFIFNRYKGRKSLFFYVKMFRGHNNIVYRGIRKFLYKKRLLQNVCNVIRFRGNQKFRKHVHGDDIQDALSPSTAIF